MLEVRRHKFLPDFAKTYLILYSEENFPVRFGEHTKGNDNVEPYQGIKPSLQLLSSSIFFREKKII